MVTCLGLVGYSPPGAQHALHHVGRMEVSDVWLHTPPHAMLLLRHVLQRCHEGSMVALVVLCVAHGQGPRNVKALYVTRFGWEKSRL